MNVIDKIHCTSLIYISHTYVYIYIIRSNTYEKEIWRGKISLHDIHVLLLLLCVDKDNPKKLKGFEENKKRKQIYNPSFAWAMLHVYLSISEPFIKGVFKLEIN